MKSDLIRLLLPVGVGVFLGLAAAIRGFLRARRATPDASSIPGAILCSTPVTKLFFAAILAFGARAPDAPRFDPDTIFFVAGNVMGLVAFAQGLFAAVQMQKMFRAGLVTPVSARPATHAPSTPFTRAVFVLGILETPAALAFMGAFVALGLSA